MLSLHDAHGQAVPAPDPVRAVRDALLAGRIVAIKGLTGFHLACDARSDEAVRELRRRKGRDQKAFAMMAVSVEAIAERAEVGDAERAEVGDAERTLLESRERPIVLLRKRAGHDLSALIAPQSAYFGFMLPYAPLHYLLFENDFPPMVMTSGNLSEEPICRENDEAVSRLAGIADLYLLHNRPIQTVCDDSVTLIQRRRPLMLRRGRGYAPRPIVNRPSRSLPSGRNSRTRSAWSAGRRRSSASTSATSRTRWRPGTSRRRSRRWSGFSRSSPPSSRTTCTRRTSRPATPAAADTGRSRCASLACSTITRTSPP
jgi:hydrogenase maturation factor HypF (carbamoyltransferase family)